MNIIYQSTNSLTQALEKRGYHGNKLEDVTRLIKREAKCQGTVETLLRYALPFNCIYDL